MRHSTPSVFLSHNSADKPFVRRLARDLDCQGITCWLDEAEIKTGESLIEKIRAGIDAMEYLAVVLSPHSVTSPWVQREVDVAMNQEIAGKRVKVLPIMYRSCEPPGFLLGKKYADFTDGSRYADSVAMLVRDLGVVFNPEALNSSPSSLNLATAANSAIRSGLPVFSRPFHRPFQFIGMTVQNVAESLGARPNAAGNFLIENDECRMFLETEGNFISYLEVEIKRTAPHALDQEFDSAVTLGALSINPGELEFAKRMTDRHIYYDHRRKLKISVQCEYDGGPLSVAIGSKYYGM